MIVVKVELHGAHSRRVTEIGRMLIGNVGGTSLRGDYEVRVLRKREIVRSGEPCDFAQWENPTTRTGKVRSYPRLSYNIWRLVLRALRSAFPEER